jgi:hypothetical protein
MAAGSSNYGGLVCASTASAGAIYTLTGSGTVVSTVGTGVSATIQSVGNNLYRCTLTFTTTAAGSLLCGFGVSDGSTYGSVLYPSAGSGTISGGFCQLEVGAFATSYIPTTTAIVGRAADVLSTTQIPWLNTAQGTMVFQADALASAAVMTNSILGSFSAGSSYTTGNGMLLRLASSANIQFGGNLTNTVSPASGYAPGLSFKAAGAYQGVNATSTVNATTPVSISTMDFTGSGTTTLTIGGLYPGAPTPQQFSGHIQSFQYFNYALTNTQLQKITT